jgi:hypothetical protein
MGPASISDEGRMPKTVRVFVLGLVVGSTGIRTAVAESSETPTIRLVVVNAARVPQEILKGAQLEATRIYAGVGVTLAWVDTAAIAKQSTQETHQPSSSLRLTISIVSNPIAGTKDSGGKLMGLATGTSEGRGTLAYVFYQRIQAFAWRVQIGIGQALGYVMAHEIGHLMLPANSHSAAGIMRADWNRLYMDRVARGEETFTTEEAALIRNKLGSTRDN